MPISPDQQKNALGGSYSMSYLPVRTLSRDIFPRAEVCYCGSRLFFFNWPAGKNNGFDIS